SVTVELTVTDNTGQQASNSSTITVNAPAAPTVKLLASASVVTSGGSVTFDGSDSKAGAGLTISTYDWKITSGASLGSFTSATNLALATVQTVGTSSGTFTVTLTVTDNLGQQASASSTVSVTAVFPTAVVAASAGSVSAGSSITFDGSGSTAPSGRTITAYQWTMASGTTLAAFSGATNGTTATVTTGAAGTLTVQLTVTDSAGAQDSKIATVIVDSGGTSGGSGGGGGATGLGWLFMLALSVGLVARARSREHRRR
ncbi:MAG TPA: PKD domain-containing protein, partial [Casimicrobiaceae bacterium]